jgi:hypothetical protein
VIQSRYFLFGPLGAIATRPTVVLISPVLGFRIFNSMKNSKNLYKRGMSGLRVGEPVRRPQIFCIVSGIPEMMLFYGAPDIHLTFA